MAYYITETCIDVKDKACVEVCPVDCIHPIDGEGEPMLYIDPDECIDCGACEPECPVEAIFAEEDMPDDQDRFVEINTKYFELRDDADEWNEWKQEHASEFEKNQLRRPLFARKSRDAPRVSRLFRA